MTDTSSPEVVIQAVGLTKHFKKVKAVEGLDLSVRRGDIYAFLGRNGAGKTTTIRMMLALAKPTDGYVEVLGTRMHPNATRAFERIGSMVETPASYGNLTVQENLELQRNLLGLHRSRWVDEVIEMCDLGEYLDRPAGKLSMGNKQRLALARALLHQPEVLILDEPTNGLDPVGIADMRSLLGRLARERNITIFLSSHNLAEVQQIATCIGIIHEGRLLEEIDYEELRKRNREFLEMRVSDTKRAAWALEERCKITDYVVREDDMLRVYSDFERASELNEALVEAGVSVSGMNMSEENLEDHFVKLTGGSSAESPDSSRRGSKRGRR